MATIPAEVKTTPFLGITEATPKIFDFEAAEQSLVSDNLDEVDRLPVIIDYNELCSEDEYPARFACKAIHETIKPIIKDEGRRERIYIGIKEMLGDMEKHADRSDTAIIILHREIGGIALHTYSKEDNSEVYIDEWGEDPYHNGLGEPILDGIFGDDYHSEMDGDVFVRHLFVWEDGDCRQFSKIHHDD